ncbi:type II secretion system F family protein [Gammaproteobacteria bacterium]|nr:type II secretion system F family protein [Gammaproteobacteria bacterium]
MAAYSYTAFDNNGLKKKGYISANSEREARKLIKDLNLIPLKVSHSNAKINNKIKVKNKDIVIMTRQLSTLLDASTSIDDSLKITADQVNDKNLSNILYNIREDIIQGKRLGNSMKSYPSIFNKTYTSLVTAGDSSGNLDTIFDNLADYLEQSEEIKQKVFSALTYPMILISFSILVIVALLAFVLPQVVGQFVKSGTELPVLTQILLFLSNNIFLILISIAGISTLGYFAYKRYCSLKTNLLNAHKIILNIPLIGNFILLTETERFASTMSLLLDSGMNLDVALDESSEVFRNAYLKEQIKIAREEVIEGKDFVNTLMKSQIFPDIFIQLIASGYKSGKLPMMFKKVSAFLKNEIESKRSIFLSLLEPIVIIFMGGFIMLIVLAILLPIMQMNTLSLG